MALDLSYPAILQQFGRHSVKQGTETRALLSWFLDNYYRLEDVEIQDAVCDGACDKGIDGIYVNPQLHKIDLFQSTIAKSDERTLGDKKLKQFAGAIAQFSSVANAEATLASANQELVKLAQRTELLKCIQDQCHPVKRGSVCWKGLHMSDLHNRNDVIDFEFVWRFFAARPVPNWPNARRKADFLSSHGLGSWRTMSPLRQPLPGQLSNS
jgi:hypothetical protein